jgi:RND family efflux transporter MFP subunit
MFVLNVNRNADQFREVTMARREAQGVLLLTLAALLALAGCAKQESPPPPVPPAVTVARPVESEVQDFNEYTGRIAAVDEVEVRARVKGYLDEIGFKDGDEVKKGQMLFQIDPRPFEAELKAAQGRRDQLKARRARAEADVSRFKDLVPQGAATAQDLDKAIADLGEAVAGIQSAEAAIEAANLELIYAKITAPMDGIASRRALSVGNLIGSSGGEQLLTTIVSVDPVQVYFDVDQRALQQVRQHALARRGGGPEPKTIRDMNIAFQFGLASEEGFPHEGVLDFIDNKVDPATGTIVVRGSVPNPQHLFKPGYFARVRVAPADPYRAMLVSDRAIGTQQGQKYVLVVDDKNTVAFRPVQIGALQANGLRVVKSGLSVSDRVVVNGIQRARPGATVHPQEGPMLPEPTTRAATTKPS